MADCRVWVWILSCVFCLVCGLVYAEVRLLLLLALPLSLLMSPKRFGISYLLKFSSNLLRACFPKERRQIAMALLQRRQQVCEAQPLPLGSQVFGYALCVCVFLVSGSSSRFSI